jgi:hypothetical protein
MARTTRPSAVNPIGRRVKLADLKDNSDPLRIGRLLSEPKQGIMKRYWDAIALMDRLP